MIIRTQELLYEVSEQPELKIRTQIEWKTQNKRINLRIDRNMMKVSVPAGLTETEVMYELKKLEPWMVKSVGKLKEARENGSDPYINEGSQVYLWGTPLTFCFEDGQPDNTWTEKDGKLIVFRRKPDPDADCLPLYDQILKQESEREGQKVLYDLLPVLREHGIRLPKISYRKMKTRWGSCTWANGTIRMNTILAQMPKEFFRLTLIHELCHFREHNHGEGFYRLFKELCPEYREIEDRRRDWLASHHILYTSPNIGLPSSQTDCDSLLVEKMEE